MTADHTWYADGVERRVETARRTIRNLGGGYARERASRVTLGAGSTFLVLDSSS